MERIKSAKFLFSSHALCQYTTINSYILHDTLHHYIIISDLGITEDETM